METLKRFIGWLFSGRIQIRLWGGVVATVVVVFVLWQLFDVNGNKRWLKWKSEWEAKGESFDSADVIPPAIPDEQNTAKSPLFEPLFSDPLQNSEAFKKASSRFALDKNKRPGQVNWRLGETRDLAAWEKAILSTDNPPVKGDTPADTILSSLKPFEADLEELANAMDKPGCRFEIRYEDVFMALLPHLSLLRDASRLYSLRASAHLAKGDTDKAMADLLRGIRVGELIGREPMLISQLVRVAILRMNFAPFCEGLHQKKWTSAQLAEFQKTIEPIDLLEGTTLAFRGERNLVNLWFDQIQAGTHKTAGTDELGVNPGYFLSLNRYHINRIITENLLTKIDVEKRHVSIQSVPTADEEVGRLTESIFKFRFALTAMLIPAYDKIILQMTSAQTELDQAKIAAGLERYRLAKGSYPETLADLVPVNLAKVPGDLFHDRGMVYRPDGDTFTLYSTGFNLTDDGGEFVLSKGGNSSIEFEQGDWPWPSAAVE